jgi:glycosyltransferase involved in cell wall biosynthesis
MIALLGRRDEPTDGVEDYCAFLGEALEKQGTELRKVRIQWAEKGWAAALRELRAQSAEWRNQWVLVQYTALAWSRRGFPFRALEVIRALKKGGAHVAVVFHEHARQGEGLRRWIDRIRGASQDWVIRRLHRNADRGIFAEPIGRISWLPRNDAKSVFIPIGANIPEPRGTWRSRKDDENTVKTVAIFCVTESSRECKREVSDISRAVRAAASRAKVRVVFMGRGTAEAAAEIGRAFREIPAEVSILSLLGAEEVATNLSNFDAMLFVRGKINLRRGSAIAGIACGLPVVGYAGAYEGTPLTEAGLVTVPYGDCDALGTALTEVLTNAGLRRSLRERSEAAQKEHFSWDAIAKALVQALGPSPKRFG